MKKGFFITETRRVIARHIATATLLAAVTVSGCSKDPFGSGPEESREIRVASSIEQLGNNDTKIAVGSTSAMTGAKFLIQNSPGMPSTVADGVMYTGDRAGQAQGAITWTAADGTPAADADKPLYSTQIAKAYIKGLWPGSGSGVTISATEFKWVIDGKTDVVFTDIWDAGSSHAPVTGAGAGETPMTFHHALAQLEVICVALSDDNVTESDVQNTWGKITKIELLNSQPEMTYILASNKMIFSGTAQAQPLVDANYTDDFPAAGIPITKANTTVSAAGMFASTEDETMYRIALKIYSEKVSEGHTITVQIKDGEVDKVFNAGKKHVITLVFSDDRREIDVRSIIVEPWGLGSGDNIISEGSAPSVGKYQYPDGSLSTKLLTDKTPVGIVFWVNPKDLGNYKVVSIDEPSATWNGGTNEARKLQWSTEAVVTEANDAASGTNNMGKIKAIADWQAKYPAFAWCDAKNTDGQSGWYLPVKSELQHLYCAYNDNLPVVWADNQNAPFYDSGNDAVRQSWSALFEAAAATGGVGLATAPYLSSEEGGASVCTYVDYVAGASNPAATKTNTDTYVRCVREYHVAAPSPDRPMIGDFRDGGVVYWIDPDDPARYNIMAPNVDVFNGSWGSLNYILGPGNGQDQNDGLKNRDAIIAYMLNGRDEMDMKRMLKSVPTGTIEIDFPSTAGCYNYQGNGTYAPKGSWYLPSIGEVYTLITQYRRHEFILGKALGDVNDSKAMFNSSMVSSTEYANNTRFIQNYKGAGLLFIPKDDAMPIRCIRRFPSPPLPEPLPLSVGTVIDGGVVFWVDHKDASRYKVFSLEEPHTLPIASSDHYKYSGFYTHDGRFNIQAMQAYSIENKNNMVSTTGNFAIDFPAASYCYNYKGRDGSDSKGTWYLPGSDELMDLIMMYFRAETLLKRVINDNKGSVLQDGGIYWSSSYSELSGGVETRPIPIGPSESPLPKMTALRNVRCIKSTLPPPPPPSPAPEVGHYYYSDGSNSPELESGKTAVGLICNVRGGMGGTSYLVHALNEAEKQWSAKEVAIPPKKAGDISAGILGSTLMKKYSANTAVNGTTGDFAIDFPAAAYCDTYNNDPAGTWYLPEEDEIKYIWSAYNGAEYWMLDADAPGADAAKQQEWNAKLKASNGTEFGGGKLPYCTSTWQEPVSQGDITNPISVDFSSGYKSAINIGTQQYNTRCVRSVGGRMII